MKKILIVLLLLPLLAIPQRHNKQCKKCTEPCSNCSGDTAKEKIVINNMLSPAAYSNALDSALQKVLIEKLGEKENKWNFLEWLLPLIVSLLAFALSYKALNRDESYKNVGFLSEVDKLLIEHPYLRGIYDSQAKNFIVGKGMLTDCTQKEYEGKLYAYCYYLINNFEVVFKYSKKGSTNRNAWENYMIHLMNESTMFRKKVIDATTDPIFDAAYQTELKSLLAIVK